jgi:hypothetical protein
LSKCQNFIVSIKKSIHKQIISTKIWKCLKNDCDLVGAN